MGKENVTGGCVGKYAFLCIAIQENKLAQILERIQQYYL